MVKQGDIIKLDFSPTIGHEQSGYRPAVVVSNDFVISKTNMIYIAEISVEAVKSLANYYHDADNMFSSIARFSSNLGMRVRGRLPLCDCPRPIE